MPPREYYLPQRGLVEQSHAELVESAGVPRSSFRGSWNRLMTFDAGFLIPFLVEEILPGDHMQYDVTAYLRMSTPLFPIFSSQRVDTFFFFCPNRLVWENWVRFMGEQDSPADSIAFTVPQMQSPSGGWAVHSVGDHFGLPVAGQITAPQTVISNSLPFRMYNLIYNQWFRDQNLQNSAIVRKTNTGDLHTDVVLHRRGKAHDYFTSSLPWPQKFTPVAAPLSGLAPIQGIGNVVGTSLAGPVTAFETVGSQIYANYWDLGVPANSLYAKADILGGAAVPQIYADLSQATGVAINTFRQAYMIQSLLERDARGGTRYVELIRSHFGVQNPDFRLQRPEFIGGGSSDLMITPVAQTAPTAGAAVGALGAAGTASGQHRASYAATEHGFIIGLINVRTELAYHQGMPRQWSRLTRYDYYWPAFAGLGEQATLKKEIYYNGLSANDDLVFGYQERWHEYRTRYSEVTGKFRPLVTGTLDAWHLAQTFDSTVALNAAFVVDFPPMERVLAAGVAALGQQYLADIMISRNAVRAVPQYGTPAVLGRF